MNKKLVLPILMSFCGAGCTSIKSSSLNAAGEAGGLTYFMPSKDLHVEFEVGLIDDKATIDYESEKGVLTTRRSELVSMRVTTVADPKYLKVIEQEIANIDAQLVTLKPPANPSTTQTSKATKISLGDSYPDTTLAFSLHSGLNHFGKNTLDVSVTESGLLSKSKSKVESKVSDALVNLAGTRAAITTAGRSAVAANGTNEVCPSKGTYVLRYRLQDTKWIVDASTPRKPDTYSEQVKCGGTDYTIKIDKMWTDAMRNGPKCAVDRDCKSKAGVFYRQSLPYSVQVKVGSKSKLAAVVYSPSESPVSMLPIKSSFFADSDTNFTFVDGVPTKYEEVSDGELVSLLRLPADVFSAYFSAVGAVFEGFKKTDTSEIDFLTKSLELELLKKKTEDCLTALEAEDSEALEALGCS